jgi:YkoY family integral membrane protein
MIETIFVVGNIIILEVLLSIDNAAVLATMVKTLPNSDQKKALTYGIVGAYIFRGLALLFASFLLKIVWLKLLGGLYLVYLAYSNLKSTTEGTNHKSISIPFLNVFWSTVVAIELADLVFSIDNVFAAVAFTDKIELIYLGVFIGIIAMRFAATGFVRLIDKHPVLEKVAFWVVGFLGVKLILSFWLEDLNLEHIDLIFSVLVTLAFLMPILLGKVKSSD